MESTVFPGIPPELQYYVTMLISLIAGWLVNKFTAVAKKVWKTEGKATVQVSIILGALVSGIGSYFSGIYGQGWPAAWQAVLAAAGTILTANGIQISRVQANEKALKEAAKKGTVTISKEAN